MNLQNRQQLTELILLLRMNGFGLSCVCSRRFMILGRIRCDLCFYSTVLKHTVRDNREVSYTIDWKKSHLYLQNEKEGLRYEYIGILESQYLSAQTTFHRFL